MAKEGLIIFLPMILFFGFFGLLIIGFLVLVIKLIKKGKDSSWEGKLIDRKFFQRKYTDDGFHKTDNFYTLIFETTEAKQVKVGVARQIYDQYKIGDKAKKEKGKLFITKL